MAKRNVKIQIYMFWQMLKDKYKESLQFSTESWCGQKCSWWWLSPPGPSMTGSTATSFTGTPSLLKRFWSSKHLKGRSAPRVSDVFADSKDFVVFLFPDTFRIQGILLFPCFWTLSVFKGFCRFPVSRHFPQSVTPVSFGAPCLFCGCTKDVVFTFV